MTKKEVRSIMKTQRNELAKSVRNEYDKSIRSRLFDSKEYRACDMLFTYVSFASEVDTIAIINNALESNKKVYVPRVEVDCMNFYQLDDLKRLVRSEFGVLEPNLDLDKRYIKPLAPEKLSESSTEKRLMLLPGLAFDKQGNRIGYGAGYYDKYLGEYNDDDFIKIALAYDFQIVDDLITDQYDISADFLVTPEMVYNCKV